MSRKTFMKDPETGKHRQANVDGMYVHYPGTCTMFYVQTGKQHGFGPRSTGTKIRLYPSRYGWVAVCYETRGFITFYVQLTKDRTAGSASSGPCILRRIGITPKFKPPLIIFSGWLNARWRAKFYHVNEAGVFVG
ncbi:hypothetical protein ACFLXQ_03645 [Chloroflexota bacterium]